MAGDFGYSSRSFRLFLIFILLFLSQRGAKVSGKGLEDIIQPGIKEPEEVEKEQNTDEDELDAQQGDNVQQTFQDYYQQAKDYLSNIPVSSGKLTIEQPPEEEKDSKGEANEDSDITMDINQDELFEDYNPVNQLEEPEMTEDNLFMGPGFEEVEVENTENCTEGGEGFYSEEPVLGGQSNLFIKPTIMSTKVNKTTGPKISIKYSK